METQSANGGEYLAFLQREIAAVLHDAEVAQRLQGMGLSVVASTPEKFDRFLRAEIDKYAALIRVANIKLDCMKVTIE